MMRQRPIVYLALVAAFGGLLLTGVPVDHVFFIGFVMFILVMHLGGHRHGGRRHGGHEELGTQTTQPAAGMATTPIRDEVTGE